MDPNDPRAEAERWLGIAAKLLTARDFLGSKTFAIRARESDPNSSLPDQILAIIDTVLAGEKRVNPSQQPDWYSVLQLPRLVRDSELIANHYRRLVMLLNPDRNRFPFADYAVQLVMDAWSVLSDPNKKWLFDNELAVFLQQVEQQQQQQTQPVRVEPVRVQQQQQFELLQSGVGSVAGSTGLNNANVTNSNCNSNQQINTFQFLQPQQPLWQQQQQQQQMQVQIQQSQREQQQRMQREIMSPPPVSQQQQIQQQLRMQREFMSPPPPPVSQPVLQQNQAVPPQWQMRDPTPVKGGGERSRGVVEGNVVGGGTTLTLPTPPVAVPFPPASTQGVTVAASKRVNPKAGLRQQGGREAGTASVRTAVADGNADNSAGNVGDSVSNCNDVNVNQGHNNNRSESVVVGNKSSGNNDRRSENVEVANENSGNTAAGNENNGGNVEVVETFWTACPYCFYTYEYQKMYQDCTLRCQHCRRGFHAVQIPNPPPISPSNVGGAGKDKDKESSFCCWGFFPLGFSLTAWKKQNQTGKASGLPNWVPFSPMFNSPGQNGAGDGNFQWFANNGIAAAGPKNFGRRPLSTPRVYIDDEEDFLADSGSSDSDSSDGDWRNPGKVKRKRRKRGNIGGPKVGRPRKVQTQEAVVQSQENQNLASGGGVSVGGENLQDGQETQEFVVGLTAGSNEDTTKKVTAALTRNQARRRAKNMGRLDLNVEFNNEGDEHAPSVSAVNGEEDVIENIAFFDGLDEFLSTLPILNVGGEEKAKPS